MLKTFAQAKGLTFVDDAVLAEAAGWITKHQKPDGSFESVGFLAHQDLMGGVRGKDGLTAYVAVALLEAGQTAAADKALDYLAGRLDAIDDPYALALTTYALELGKSPRATEAHDKLMAAAIEDEDGLHWHAGGAEPQPLESPPGAGRPAAHRRPGRSDAGRRHRGHRLRDAGPDRRTATAPTLPARPNGSWDSGTARAGSARPRTRWWRSRRSPRTPLSRRPTPTSR